MAGKIVFATFSTWVTPTIHVNKGEAWDADDPVVRSHPDWFTDTPPDVRTSGSEVYDAASANMAAPPSQVERATAEPGEKRTVSTAKPTGKGGKA